MRLTSFLLALIVVLSGCATCREETFVKPQLKVGDRLVSPWNNEKGFTYSLAQNFELSLTGCNYFADQTHDFICVGLTPNPGIHVKFSSGQYQLDDTQSSNIRTEDIPNIRVQIPFFPDKSGAFPPQAERKKGLPDSAIETEISGNQYAIQKGFSFPAVSEFQGGEVIGTTFRLVREFRTFYFKLPFPRNMIHTTTVQLPAVQVNGQPIVFPTIVATRVTENICYRPK